MKPEYNDRTTIFDCIFICEKKSEGIILKSYNVSACFLAGADFFMPF